LERMLRDAILDGALRPGVRLPGSRRFAEQLGVSRGVVTEAYEQLSSQGLLATQRRSAPVVKTQPVDAIPTPVIPPALTPRYDLSPWATDLDLFPLRRWLTTGQRVARRAPTAILDYREDRGERALREALADHLGRTRGVIADPEQIVVTHGTAQALDLVGRVLRGRGAHQIALEDPSPDLDRARVAACGLTAVARRVDQDGIIVTGMAADAVLVAPSHQCPTGVVLRAQRRRELLAWARDARALVVERDCDSEFSFDGKPIRALQGLAPECVAHVGSVSKALAPAIRLGWLVAPADLVDEVTYQKRLVDGFSSPFDQLTLAEFLRSGDYDRHVRALRMHYHARRDRLVEALARRLPELEVAGANTGVHVVLSLPARVSDVEIAERALRARIRVSALSQFCIDRTDLNGLVVGYGRLHEDAIDLVVRALAAKIQAPPERGELSPRVAGARVPMAIAAGQATRARSPDLPPLKVGSAMSAQARDRSGETLNRTRR
jgi:GntR family transcriptional regulator/MocR family aminotransferase